MVCKAAKSSSAKLLPFLWYALALPFAQAVCPAAHLQANDISEEFDLQGLSFADLTIDASASGLQIGWIRRVINAANKK